MNGFSDGRIKTSQLRALVAVATHNRFSSAALELGISQSAVSHAIATLEEALGVVLLIRGRHGATLTPIGESITQDAQRVLTLLAGMREKANQERGLQSGQVRLAAMRSMATHLLPEVIAQFRQQFPTIKVTIEEYAYYAELEKALRQGQADIGLTSLPLSSEFEVWELFRDEFVALLPPDTPLDGVTLSWDQLVRYPMIMNPVAHPHRHTQIVQDHLAQFGYTLKVDYEVKEDSTILNMVKQGLGAAVMARLAAEPIPEEIQVRNLPIPVERIVAAAVLADALLPQSVFVFLDMLKAIWQEAQLFGQENAKI
ncbi:MAG: LysR family transcriptional regulator [Leptolyngbyaceae cyanobacterium MO_188.B28]|nr:LysR family transcriptional regulator [Leptolyngbyaceae cyanobacterium MO_188.B28]